MTKTDQRLNDLFGIAIENRDRLDRIEKQNIQIIALLEDLVNALDAYSDDYDDPLYEDNSLYPDGGHGTLKR